MWKDTVQLKFKKIENLLIHEHITKEKINDRCTFLTHCQVIDGSLPNTRSKQLVSKLPGQNLWTS